MGYPLVQTQQELTPAQTRFLLIAVPEALNRMRQANEPRGSERAMTPQQRQTAKQAFQQKIAERKQQQRQTRR